MSKYKIIYHGNVNENTYTKRPLPGRDEWTKALRGGLFHQGQHALADFTGKFCCLGVKCVIDNRPEFAPGETPNTFCGLGIRRRFDGLDDVIADCNPAHDYLGSLGFFPPSLSVQITSDSELDLEGNPAKRMATSLADCNDMGLEFSQIAEIIDIVWEHVATV